MAKIAGIMVFVLILSLISTSLVNGGWQFLSVADNTTKPIVEKVMNSELSQRDSNPDIARDCLEAIALGIQFLQTTEINPEQYKLISATSVQPGLVDAGAHIWRLTFKLKALIPDTAEAVLGAGGEIFVEIDLATKTAKLLGYGE